MLFSCAAARARLTHSLLHVSAPRQESSCKPSNTPPQTLEEQGATIRTFSLLERADGNGIHFLFCVRSTWSFTFLPDPISLLRGSFFVVLFFILFYLFFFTKKPKKQQPRNHYFYLFLFKFMDLLLGWGGGGSSFTLINDKPSAAQVLRGHGARLWLVETQAPAFVNAPVSCGSIYI